MWRKLTVVRPIVRAPLRSNLLYSFLPEFLTELSVIFAKRKKLTAPLACLGLDTAVVYPDQKGLMPVHHGVATMTHWTLLSHLEISLLMLVTVLSAAAITFCDSVLAPFLQVDLLPLTPLQML